MENHWWQCTLYVTERGLTTKALTTCPRSASQEISAGSVSSAVAMIAAWSGVLCRNTCSA